MLTFVPAYLYNQRADFWKKKPPQGKLLRKPADNIGFDSPQFLWWLKL
jgi:hypothetical protein